MEEQVIRTKDIKTDPLAHALATSDEMRLYLNALIALTQGKTAEEALARIRQLPIEQHYITRVFNNLDVALADLDTETMRLDLDTLPARTGPELLEKGRFRPLQLKMLVEFLEQTLQSQTKQGS